MKITVHREACCSQDDQMGPLDMTFDVDAQCRLDAFLAAVTGARFLQFSSSHTEMSCRIAGVEVARVFSPYEVPRRATVFVAAPDALLQSLAPGGAVDFIFDRVH